MDPNADDYIEYEDEDDLFHEYNDRLQRLDREIETELFGDEDDLDVYDEDSIISRIETLRNNFMELQDENHVLLSKVNNIDLRFDEYESEIKDLKKEIKNHTEVIKAEELDENIKRKEFRSI